MRTILDAKSATIYFRECRSPAGRIKAPTRASLVDFESNPLGEIAGFDGKTAPLTVNSKQILTIRFD